MLSNYIYHYIGLKSIWWCKKIIGKLSHNGVLFPPEYEAIKVPIIYKGKEIILNPEAEEAVYFMLNILIQSM